MIPHDFTAGNITVSFLPVEGSIRCFVCNKKKKDVWFQVIINRLDEEEYKEKGPFYSCKDCIKKMLVKFVDTGVIEMEIDKEGILHFKI
nr:hypothetical protein [Candidatus Sigynarchaeota archaeon]